MDASEQALPPAGELVQITTRNGLTGVAWWSPDEDLRWMQSPTLGNVRWPNVASWCRVLVLPDTDETREVMAEAAVEAMTMLDKHLALQSEPLDQGVARQYAETGLAAAFEAACGGCAK